MQMLQQSAKHIFIHLYILYIVWCRYCQRKKKHNTEVSEMRALLPQFLVVMNAQVICVPVPDQTINFTLFLENYGKLRCVPSETFQFVIFTVTRVSVKKENVCIPQV